MEFYVWGTGAIADQLIGGGINGVLKGFVETRKRRMEYKGYPVYGMDEIAGDRFDYIIVANRFSDEIYSACIEKNMDMKKIVFMVRGKNTEFVDNPEIREMLGTSNYLRYAAEYGRNEGDLYDGNGFFTGLFCFEK